jgi:hypothetical protein
MTIVSSGELPQEASTDDWTSVLEIPQGTIVNSITLINEGDWPGFWRVVEGEVPTAPARLPVGGGEPGGRRAAVNISCRSLTNARLEVKRGVLAGNLTGLWAFAQY